MELKGIDKFGENTWQIYVLSRRGHWRPHGTEIIRTEREARIEAHKVRDAVKAPIKLFLVVKHKTEVAVFYPKGWKDNGTSDQG